METAVLILIILLVLTFIVAFGVLQRQKQKIRRKDQALIREITEHAIVADQYLRLKGRKDLSVAQKDKESIPLLKNKSDEELFEFFRVVIVNEGLYLAPAFNRQELANRFHLSEERIAKAFSRGSGYGSLQSFITECRLNESVRMLSEHPEIAIRDVARLSGYANENAFAASFEIRYTITPEEFRQHAHV